MRIDDFADESLVSELGARWRGVSDQVMGGLSKTSLSHNVLDHRTCLRLTGDVRLENDGGFIQAAVDLTHSRETLDAECASPSVAMAKNTRFISARQIMSGLGSPTGRISPPNRTGRSSSFLSRALCLIGWMHPWTGRSSVASGLSL